MSKFLNLKYYFTKSDIMEKRRGRGKGRGRHDGGGGGRGPGLRRGPRDGSGPNPDCEKKKRRRPSLQEVISIENPETPREPESVVEKVKQLYTTIQSYVSNLYNSVKTYETRKPSNYNLNL